MDFSQPMLKVRYLLLQVKKISKTKQHKEKKFITVAKKHICRFCNLSYFNLHHLCIIVLNLIILEQNYMNYLLLLCHFLNVLTFLFYLVFFHEHSRITGLQGKGESISLTPHYHFHPLHKHLDISRVITTESSPLHIANSRSRAGNLWFPSAIHKPQSIAFNWFVSDKINFR